MINIYCERNGPEIWAEPLNALTNLAFIIAAVLLYVRGNRQGTLNAPSYVLLALIFAIGVGSGLFHIFATRTTMLADVLPILIFQITFLIVYSRTVMRTSPINIVFLLAGYMILTVFFGSLSRDLFNGTLQYAPAFMYVLGFGLYHAITEQPSRYSLITAAALFFVSMIFRSIDQQICSYIPIGTHFVWHILNAVVLYLCTSAILDQKARI